MKKNKDEKEHQCIFIITGLVHTLTYLTRQDRSNMAKLH